MKKRAVEQTHTGLIGAVRAVAEVVVQAADGEGAGAVFAFDHLGCVVVLICNHITPC